MRNNMGFKHQKSYAALRKILKTEFPDVSVTQFDEMYETLRDIIFEYLDTFY